ncbi:LamB/YcsF family protein [compost metagenome]
MDVASDELTADVIYQIGALQGLAKAAGTCVRYVKPHGALYNTIAHDRRQALAVIEAIRTIDSNLILVALAGSSLIELARNEGLQCIAEAFADRAYTPQGTLVSRREPGAVLHDPKLVAQRMLRLVEDGTIEAIDGSLTRIQADSICVHGDSPAAVEMARELRRVLEQANMSLLPFAGGRP